MGAVIALGDKVFYFLGGMFFSQILFAFTGFFLDINHLILAFAAFLVIGTGWVIYRSILRQRTATSPPEGNSENPWHR